METTLHNPARQLMVGVDVGGSKIAVLVADATRRVRAQVTTPTPLNGADTTLAGIEAAICQALVEARADVDEVAGVGMGTPGLVDSTSGVVRHAVNLGWEEVPAGSWLAARLGVPCFLENDVRLAALGVQQHPAFAGARSLAYVSVGTGIAAGLILDGRLYRGAHGMAGEIGHTILDPAGPRCTCGARGCLEALAGGLGIARLGRQAVESGVPTRLGVDGPVTAQAVYAAARAGDAAAIAIVARVSAYLAQALQQLVLTYDPDHIVLGGGVARARAAFFAPIMDEIERLRQESALSREMLRPEMFHLLPADYDAGPWGGVTLVRNHTPGGPEE